MPVYTVFTSKYHTPICNPICLCPHRYSFLLQRLWVGSEFHPIAFSQSRLNYSVLCSATFWHLRFMVHVGFWARNAVRYPRPARRWIQISLFAFIAAPVLIPQCCKPWLMSSPNMLANGGPLQLHRSLASDFLYRSLLCLLLHFCTTSNIWGLFLSPFVAKDLSKCSLPLTASTPGPVILDKANCWCLCSSHVLLLLLSSLQVDMLSSQSVACLYLG